MPDENQQTKNKVLIVEDDPEKLTTFVTGRDSDLYS